MGTKNHEPRVVITTSENGMKNVYVPLKGDVEVPAEAYAPNAQLFLVERPADVLRPPTLRVSSKLNSKDVLAQVAANPRANLVIE